MNELLANKIAAGEVVEKCASVVKELVENSIDAQSTNIKIELIDAGTRQIKVTDNGIGMSKKDASLAFYRHATSKVITEDDLFHIETLGFRGEALAAIASVSNIILKTSTGQVGTEINLIGGIVQNIKNSQARTGTSICVTDLFYNTPARLKHMKSLYAELANITDYVNKLTLACPEISFTLINNDNNILKTDGSDNLLKTIKEIYGINVAKKMMEIHNSNNDYQIDGFISLPEINKTSRNNMITIVNKRVVKNVEINRVINDSYHSYKPDNRYPIVILNITVDPTIIDVNIHPTKMDIKFSKINELGLLIATTIKECLQKTILIPQIEVSERSNNYQELAINFDEIAQSDNVYNEIEYKEMEYNFLVDDKDGCEELIKLNNYPSKQFPKLYVVGVVHGTYVICQNEKGMYLIDQHAAKERINYEYYKEELGNPNSNQTAMLFPITIELSNSEYIVLQENFDLLAKLKFIVEPFGLNSIVIKAHPTWLPKGYEQQAINQIIEVLIVKEKNFTILKFNEKIATMLSCKQAIKANEAISNQELEQMIEDLSKCHNPYNCPHGRPTIIYYSTYDLEKLFKRSGF